MAKKSKTQRAKASAARAQRKAQAREAEASKNARGAKAPKRPRRRSARFSRRPARNPPRKAVAEAPAQEKKPQKKADKPVKKKRFQFLRDVKSEMKRVTWPKQDVLRWSVVVVAALVFFGVYVALLDNVVITPLLVAISGLIGV